MDSKQEINEKLILMFDRELELHPRARLIDLFKLFMQSAFGPGHLIKNKDIARKYLIQELESPIVSSPTLFTSDAQAIQTPLIFDCDVFHPFARYSLKLIADKTISFDDFFAAFIQSAESFSAEKDADYYLGFWNEMTPYFTAKNIELFDYDSAEIKKLISQKQYLVRHSYTYNIYYKPAYRIINKSMLFEQTQ